MSAEANVVSRLSQIIPMHKNHIIYFENFIHGLLIQPGNISYLSIVFQTANYLLTRRLKQKHVDFRKNMLVHAMANISTVLWKDNKCVRLASTYVGTRPFKTGSVLPVSAPNTARFDREKNSKSWTVQRLCMNIMHTWVAWT